MTAEDSHQKKFIKMTTEPVEKLIRELSVPTIVSMMITAIYNLADTFFVGRINSSATAAVGVIFSLMAVIQAVGFFFGHGSGNYISRKLGEKNIKNATIMASVGFFSSFFIGCIISIIGLIYIEPLANILGSTNTVLPYAEKYMFFILLSCPFFASSLVLNNQLRLQGNAMQAMIGIGIGSVLNCIMDPIFIFGMGMGISGAGLSTFISQLVSFFVLLVGNRKSDAINITFSNFKPNKEKYIAILQGGLPSLERQGLNSLSNILLNQAIKSYGDCALAAMTIVLRIVYLIISVIIGWGQGFQPVCGFNFGAKLYDRVETAYKYCHKVAFIILTILLIICEIAAPEIIAFFSNEKEVIKIGTLALRLQCITLQTAGFAMICSMLLQNINLYKEASLLALARQGLFFIPLIFIWESLFGLTGILACQPIADILSLIMALIMNHSVLRKIRLNLI